MNDIIPSWMKNTISFENHGALGWAIAHGLSLDAEFIKRK